MKLDIDKFKFDFTCSISPEKNGDGSIRTFMPQDRYKNDRGIPLNKYGKGPFCKFKIPSNWNTSGVYAIVVDDLIKYIGECANLSSRYNMGYGNISPRNCFIGGQETNCRINHLIFESKNQGDNIDLWFYETSQYKEIESALRSSLTLEWNRV